MFSNYCAFMHAKREMVVDKDGRLFSYIVRNVGFELLIGEN